jgi:hypothetical protein
MANLYHDQLSGSDLHDNKAYASTGTELSPASQASYDNRWTRQTRTISTAAPLSGGGDLSANRALTLPAATASQNGYLTSDDWTTFSAKGYRFESVVGPASSTGNDYTCTGTNDDVPIQAALNLVHAAGGGRIVLRNGVYTVRPELLRIYSDTILEGETRDKVIIQVTDNGTFSRVFRIDGTAQTYATNIQIRNLFISGALVYPLGQSPRSNTFGIACGYVENLVVEDVRFEQFEMGLSVNTGRRIWVNRTVDYTGSLTGGSKNLVQLLGVSEGAVTNCIHYGNDTALRIQGCHKLYLGNNKCYTSSIEIGNAQGFGYSDYIIVAGNYLEDAPVNLINFSDGADQVKSVLGYSAGVDNVIVQGNTFRLHSVANLSGVLGENFTTGTISSISNVTVHGNDFLCDTPVTIKQSGVSTMANNGRAINWSITGNTFADFTGASVSIVSGIDVSVHDNKLLHFNRGAGLGQAYDRCAVAVRGTATYGSSYVSIKDNSMDGNATAFALAVYLDDPSLIDHIDIEGNNIRGVGGGGAQPIYMVNGKPSGVIRDNQGYATESSGIAAAAQGTTSITINHGLAMTPVLKDITVTPTNSLGNATKFWVSNPTSTQFNINVNADPGATTATFAWKAVAL